MDTWLSHSGPRIELSRGIVAECAVTPPPIIEYRDVLEDVLCGLVPRAGLAMSSHASGCRRSLDTGLVSTVSPPRQTAGHTVHREQFLVWRGSILAAPIRVVQHSGFRGAMADCYRQRLQRESTHQPIRQVEPALRGPDIGDIRGPHDWAVRP